ncbi:hypothetical protein [Cyanobacterium sp. Dongsha4]|uniref:hypothetical protein n=1 Tax=Cyanobacterium sp. DS4 TaxID=2878255 RepID=UPI002E8121B8|nr:hypothetical protein [Cyanobacterium sp. Dongsha4]
MTMKINLNTDQQIIEEAFNVLIDHLDVVKVMRFWEICHLGKGDYSELKNQLFKDETVDTLYDKIKAFENSQQENG